MDCGLADAEGDADGGGCHGGGVVDAVAELERGGLGGFGFHQCQFLFGSLAGKYLATPSEVRHVLTFPLPVSPPQHHPAEIVVAAPMAN